MKFVTAYAVTREYGGPEEGGWWWNCYEPLQVVPVAPEDAEAMKSVLQKRHDHVAHGDIYSVLGGCALEVYVEDEPAESETRERPRYE